MSSDWLRGEATARRQSMRDNGKVERWSANGDREFIGMTGEKEFSQASGLPMKFLRGVSDEGWDFVIPFRYTLDVKTTTLVPAELLVPCDKVTAHIYVLAGYISQTNDAILLGWQWGTVVKRAPTKQMPSGINHVIDIDGLYEMHELLDRIMRLR